MKVRSFTGMAFAAAALLLFAQCDNKTGTDENPAGQSIDNTNGNTQEEGYMDNEEMDDADTANGNHSIE